MANRTADSGKTDLEIILMQQILIFAAEYKKIIHNIINSPFHSILFSPRYSLYRIYKYHKGQFFLFYHIAITSIHYIYIKPRIIWKEK